MDHKELTKATQLLENNPVARFHEEYMEEKNCQVRNDTPCSSYRREKKKSFW